MLQGQTGSITTSGNSRRTQAPSEGSCQYQGSVIIQERESVWPSRKDRNLDVQASNFLILTGFFKRKHLSAGQMGRERWLWFEGFTKKVGLMPGLEWGVEFRFAYLRVPRGHFLGGGVARWLWTGCLIPHLQNKKNEVCSASDSEDQVRSSTLGPAQSRAWLY